MARSKTAVVVAPEAPTNPALDIQAMIAREIAKALGNLALPAGSAAPTTPKPAPKLPVPVTVIPPVGPETVRVVTGYRDRETGEAKPFKGNGVKLIGLTTSPFGGISLACALEVLERIDDLEKAVKAWRPTLAEHVALKDKAVKALDSGE